MKNCTLRTIMLVLALGTGACAGQGETSPASAGEVVARFGASEATQSLGVDSWQVHRSEQTTKMLGFDKAGATTVELLLAADSDEVVKVSSLLPEASEMTLAKSGDVDGNASDLMRALVKAAFSDSQDPALRREPGSQPEEPGLGKRQLGLRLDASGEIYLGWSFFGYRGEIMEGNWCSQGALRDSADAMSDSGASCWIVRWNSNVPTDCQVLVHYGISGFRSDVCRWYTYTQ